MPAIRLPAELSGYRPQDVGLVTHAVVAVLAPHLRDFDEVSLPSRVLDVAGTLVNGANVNRRRVLMLTAAGHASTYLRRYAPTSPWELVGCEYDTGGGRTDLAWRDTETGRVFFDEIKTHNRPIHAHSPRVIAQVKAQAKGGLAEFGDLFAGVRLVPLGALHLTVLIRHGQTRTPLAPTRTDPLRHAPSKDGEEVTS